MPQATLDFDGSSFNPGAAESLRDAGKSLTAESRDKMLSLARSIARSIALEDAMRECTIDAVQQRLIAMGYQPAQLGPAAGCIFLSDEWDHAGFVQSTRASNRRRWIQVHRLR